MFDKLFKPKPLDELMDTPSNEAVEDQSTENPVSTESPYIAEITVKYDRDAAYETRRYEVQVDIRKKYKNPRGSESLRYVTSLHGAAQNESLGLTKGEEMAKKWLSEQVLIDKPMKKTIDL